MRAGRGLRDVLLSAVQSRQDQDINEQAENHNPTWGVTPNTETMIASLTESGP